ncbi:hypothetical protein IWW47_000616 [Coemansia sp. RSA 2052]|nr:hypothetical protein GGF38_000025 [Coemansia sp. RSA 25]KAJ2508426.1 hypothetical protein IWW47_000616 [Coemansia sp. RSA 2052]
MQRAIPCLLGRLPRSVTIEYIGIFARQPTASRWALRGLNVRGSMTGVSQTRCLHQAQWHRKAGEWQSATAEVAPSLVEQSASKRACTVQETVDPIDLVSLRVGRIDGVERHPEADKLYVLSVDVGERSSDLPEAIQRRTIVSGLVQYYSPGQLLGRHVVVFANLKPRKLRGIMSHGMLLAASSLEREGSVAVEILEAPASSSPGDRIRASPTLDTTEKPLVKKQKQVDLFIGGLALDAGIASYNGHKLLTDAGGEISTSALLTGVVG